MQGPPGSGKTSTVVAMISALLANKGHTTPAHQIHQQTAVPPKAQSRTAGTLKAAPSVRVLVCAQSNAAIDELIMRLADPGIFGTDGRYR